jgi:acetyl esterase/lipase
MVRRSTFVLAVSLVSSVLAPACRAADDPGFTRQEDVVYARKFGSALTMDVFKPKKPANGAGLIFVVSGGWFSSHENISGGFVKPFTNRGYTVFAVVHGSQPRYTIPDVVQDMLRSVRFIRTHAKEYGVDPERLGIYGGSAGGHLSLMVGTSGEPANPSAKDPVDKASSRVQAVACFFPPTDFLNYGHDGVDALGRGILAGFKAPFDFQEFDKNRNTFVPIVDEAERVRIGRSISPVNHVSPDDPPTLIIHGDADKLVPIQQAQLIVARLEKVKVPVSLVVKPGAVHGWPGIDKDLETFADWFDKYIGHAATPAPK